MEEAAVNANAARECREDEAEEGEWLQHPHAAGGGETSALTRAVAAACANMDPSALVDVLRLSGRSSLRAFLPVLLGAPDPHALLVRAVGGFLDLASAPLGRDTSEWWANCVALIECAPRLVAPSPDALAQAKRLAGHWKEMVVAGPAGAGGRDIGGMAGWGLLTFIASYSIAPEFDADEIIRLFDNIAPQVKDNCVELCKRLGLIGKMNGTSSSTSTLNDEFTCLISKAQFINHFIENGQPLDAIRLAYTFSLTDKYPPLTIMNDYVVNAKKTAEDILSKESYTLESLNQAMAKKVDALIFSWSAVDGCDIDSVQRNSIKAEITQLLHKYANKQQSLAAEFSRAVSAVATNATGGTAEAAATATSWTAAKTRRETAPAAEATKDAASAHSESTRPAGAGNVAKPEKERTKQKESQEETAQAETAATE
ncbi:unnamed protein product [Miscanthus lutarioriparius]|uniref:FRIGIDA-like protein n=1 Tax=Miscanthus lutarioriparius TaxID=422564 RepID=A0A811MEP8_9POAL|nr:unnamed protein product [Miscanthus lutarioriparius]